MTRAAKGLRVRFRPAGSAGLALGTALAAALLLAPVNVLGQDSPADGLAAAPILHEYVPPDGADHAAWAREGRLPDQLRVGDHNLPRPASSPRPRRPERVRAHDTMDRETAIDPDRTTTHDGVLSYTAEFNPSVVPFKRMAAFDRVDEGYRLGVQDATRRPIVLARRSTPPTHAAFWGSMVLRLRAGVPMAIPSVAAEAVIVSYSSTPPAVFEFFRDSADNYTVRADRDGQFRLIFVTDAPHAYFAPEIPALVTAAHVPPARRPRLPDAVQRAAARVHHHIGVRPRQTIRRQLDRLVAYFRNFTAAPLDRDSGDTYLDISLGQRGVCRHRSWAFAITAQALGIPARYVQNEAHAFAEVFVPRLGWIRIDLGGASTALQVANARDKAIHDPGPDPFPRPTRFTHSSYSHLAGGNVRGIRVDQRLRPAARQRGRLSRLRQQARASASAASPTEDPAAKPATEDRDRAAATENGVEADSPATSEDRAPETQRPTRISVACADNAAARGDTVRFWGRVASDAGQGLGGLRVEIYLTQSDSRGETMLGATVTDEKGRYDVRLAVPRNLTVGEYRIHAATPGNARLLPSVSR